MRALQRAALRDGAAEAGASVVTRGNALCVRRRRRRGRTSRAHHPRQRSSDESEHKKLHFGIAINGAGLLPFSVCFQS